MRLLLSLALLSAMAYGVWQWSEEHPHMRHRIESLLDVGHFHTLEIRYRAEQIMESQRKHLLKDGRHRYLDPVLTFYPYLLMEVKYTVSKDKTAEGLMLWDLTDGEMVIDTKHWEKTHGFGDCIDAHCERHEFKVLHALAKRGGTGDREDLASALHTESETLQAWIDSCLRKQLIVHTKGRYRLHLQNPKLHTKPATKIEERLVTQPHRKAIRLSKRYSLSQIEQITKAAFGNDFAIRKTTSVYLPVHSITVQNPDGSIHTSHWNALTGRPLASRP